MQKKTHLMTKIRVRRPRRKFHIQNFTHASSRCTQNTHSVHDVQYSLFTITNMKCVLVAQGLTRSKIVLCHFCAHKWILHQVSHVISTSPLFQSITTRSTTWTTRSSPRRHCMQYTKKLFHGFRKQSCRKATPGRKETLKNHSFTKIWEWRKLAPKYSHTRID